MTMEFFKQNSHKICWIWIFLELDDHRIFIKFFKDSDQNSNLSIQPFRWLWNSSRIRWPQNSHIIFQGFWSENWGALWVGIGGCEYWWVFQDFGLNARKENSNPKKRERELYSRLKSSVGCWAHHDILRGLKNLCDNLSIIGVPYLSIVILFVP